ncbi:MAG: DUF2784 domain-containing protein [Acidobacteriaceae bacterium]
MRLLAALVLAFHLAWILWVIFGAVWTRGRKWLTGLHIASIVWGIVAEVGPWSCPLTILEDRLEARAGIQPYNGGCLVHYLDSIVYPTLSVRVIVGCAIAVCGANLLIYLVRLVRAFTAWAAS